MDRLIKRLQHEAMILHYKTAKIKSKNRPLLKKLQKICASQLVLVSTFCNLPNCHLVAHRKL